LDEDDDELVDHVRKRLLVAPNEEDHEYFLDRPNVTDPSKGLALTVAGLLANMVLKMS
jgi:hypothetical protein